MSARYFRLLLAASLLLGLLGVVLDQIVLPAVSQEQMDAEFSQMAANGKSLGWFLLTLCLLIGTGLAGAIGLFFFKPWALRLSLFLTILSPVLIAISALELPPSSTVSSPWAGGLNYLSSVLWGAVLALALWSPGVRARFQQPQ